MPLAASGIGGQSTETNAISIVHENRIVLGKQAVRIAVDGDVLDITFDGLTSVLPLRMHIYF
jgi:hypothetical protein